MDGSLNRDGRPFANSPAQLSAALRSGLPRQPAPHLYQYASNDSSVTSAPSQYPVDKASMTKREKFEYERQVIIGSVLSKLDASGNIQEDYITHVRVIERNENNRKPFSIHDIGLGSRKDRVLIVAVKNTGSISMLKARENQNGTFSEGKRWPFEDLVVIESFGNRIFRNKEEEENVAKAGETGFALSFKNDLAKGPHFWQTDSVQEKAFFITSLAKIYQRYTRKRPQLVGFTTEELNQVYAFADQLTGARSQRSPSGHASPSLTENPSTSHPSVYSQLAPSSQRSQPPPQQTSFSRPFGSPTATSPLASQKSPYADTASSSHTASTSSHSRLHATSTSNPNPNASLPYSSSETASVKSSTSDFKSSNLPDESYNRPGSGRRPGPTFYNPVQVSSLRESTPSPASSVRSPNNPGGLGIASATLASRKASGDSMSTFSSNSADDPSAKPPVSVPERRRPPLNSPNDVDVPRPLVTRNNPRGSDGTYNSSLSSPSFEPPPRSSHRLATADSNGRSTPELTRSAAVGSTDRPLMSPVSLPKEFKSAALDKAESNGSTEEARPGLGRMFGPNKQTTKQLLSKAAGLNTKAASLSTKYGTAGRLLALESKSREAESATLASSAVLKRTATNESTQAIQSDSLSPDIRDITPVSTAVSPQPPQSSRNASRNLSIIETNKKLSDLQQKEAELQLKVKEDAAKRKPRRTPLQINFVEGLDLDPIHFEAKGLEYEYLHEEFWPPDQWNQKTADQLQADLRRQMSSVQTGGWFEHIARHEKERAAALQLIDDALAEINELETLFTLYLAILGTLSENIAYIEAQGQGLQVQTVNQKILATELQDILNTINIPPQDLDPVYSVSPVSIEGLESVERSLLALYKALALSDPSSKQNSADGSVDISGMQALQEKRPLHLDASNSFLSRFKSYMDAPFGQATADIQNVIKNKSLKPAETNPPLVHVNEITAGRDSLWKYSPLMLYAKAMNRNTWTDIIKSYQRIMQEMYSDSVSGNIKASQQRAASGPPGDDQDLWFIGEPQVESFGSTARKLGVMRSQTLARTFRNSTGDKALRHSMQGARSLASANTGGLPLPYEVVEQFLDKLSPLVFNEQAFIITYFHANTTETADFPELALSTLPENRHTPSKYSLQQKRFEPDPEMAKFVTSTVSDIFSFLPSQVQALIDWALGMGALQGIGILQALHALMATLDDGFFLNLLHSCANRLTNKWNDFLSNQVRAIEETQVKVKKRKGILFFMRVFPIFAACVESMLPVPPQNDEGEVRKLIDQAYSQINKAMFNSLRAIAKESPTAHASTNDPEDKESLNYHILIIENMNHYIENVETKGDNVLEAGKRKASEEFNEHLTLYVDSIIRRPLGKIMNFTEALESSAVISGSKTVDNAALTPAIFRKLATNHDKTELRRGVEALRKRIEKHFGDVSAEEAEVNAAAAPGGGNVVGSGHSHSRNQSANGPTGATIALLQKVLIATEQRYLKEIMRMRELPINAYGEEATRDVWTFGETEVSRWFRGGR